MERCRRRGKNARRVGFVFATVISIDTKPETLQSMLCTNHADLGRVWQEAQLSGLDNRISNSIAAGNKRTTEALSRPAEC